MGDFVAYNSRWRLALLILAGIGFVLAGLWMGGALGTPPPSDRYPAPVAPIFGWFCAVFFGFATLVMIKRLFDTGERVRIGRSGVLPSPAFHQPIPWSEIRDVTTWQYRGQKMIILCLRDPSLFDQTRDRAFLARANAKLTGGDVAINLAGTDGDFDAAMAAIHRFRPR